VALFLLVISTNREYINYMMDNIKIDLNEVSWYLWIVVISAIFMCLSLIYNSTYIYLGFLTFVYGIIGHVAFTTFDKVIFKEENKKLLYNILLHIIIEFSWIVIAISIITKGI